MRRSDGKMDRRSTEYKDAVARLAKARRAMKAKRSARRAPRRASSGPRRSDGGLDQRTKAGRAMASKMAALRAMRGRKKSFFAWLMG